jgi:hypothetical protein
VRLVTGWERGPDARNTMPQMSCVLLHPTNQKPHGVSGSAKDCVGGVGLGERKSDSKGPTQTKDSHALARLMRLREDQRVPGEAEY